MEDQEETTEENEEDVDDDAPAPAAPATGDDTVEASLDELLAKKAVEAEPAEEESEDEAIMTLGKEERIETLSVKVIPQQPTEFVCKKCFLVKHQSQLADKRRTYCRDCA